MNKIFFTAVFLALFLAGSRAYSADVPVFSANGFVCGKEGVTVTCKGPHPNRKDTITGTGHDLVYLTVNAYQQGVPVRYSYFSDTGCLIGYTFNAAGQPATAVASHRKGAKQTFSFSGKADYEKITTFCVSDAPSATSAAPDGKPAGGDSAKTATAPEK